jgi:hypothetical protein
MLSSVSTNLVTLKPITHHKAVVKPKVKTPEKKVVVTPAPKATCTTKESINFWNDVDDVDYCY